VKINLIFYPPAETRFPCALWLVNQWQIQRGGNGGGAPPIGSHFCSKSRFFPRKRHIFRCAHLR